MNTNRRKFLKIGALGAVGATLTSCFTPKNRLKSLPKGLNTDDRRILIKGGAVLSLDKKVGNFDSGDVLIEGQKIVDIGVDINAPDAVVIDAVGKIVMPGFVDTHHHQFETALRSQLSNGLLKPDGRPVNANNYIDTIIHNFAGHYRPEDVYISELVGGLSQLDAGVTTVLDVSQINHSPEHIDAAIKGLVDSGRRSVFGYFDGQGEDSKYPNGAVRVKKQYFSSDDQLTTMAMGGENFLSTYKKAWEIGRELGLLIVGHVVGSLHSEPELLKAAAEGLIRDDNLFIHMTNVSDKSLVAIRDAGAHVSMAVPIEMHMRHGAPPIQKAIDMGISVSLSTDVECTMTADFFTQMRGVMTLQRMLANEKAIAKQEYPKLMRCIDAIEMATIGGAKGLRLDDKIGSLSIGKDADIILLDADAINVMPLNNVPGAVVTLMDRSNVDTVMVAGKVKKWKGKLLDVDLPKLRNEIKASRDYLFRMAGVEKTLFN